jgi:hypothetical protein
MMAARVQPSLLDNGWHGRHMNSSKRINNTLTQQSRSTGEMRSFEIYNDKFIKVATQSLFGNKTYHLNMSMLEPWPSHHRKISWRWLLSVLCFGLLTAALSLYLYQHQDQQTLSRLLPYIVAFVLLTLGSLIMFVYRSPNVMEFRSRYGNCTLLSLLHNKPSRKTFKAFVAELRARILAASQAVTFDKKQMLAIEMKELRRLTEEGALNEDDYERAKARLLNMKL